jgi:DNA-directed RNA polymerase specialized sigma24 family protein
MNAKQVENLIYEYHWRRREVDRLENILFGSSIPMKSWGVAQYGIEAAMPKGSSGRSLLEIESMDLREQRLFNRLESFRDKVYAVEMIAGKVNEEQQLIIIDCMMEGMSYRAIAAHLGVSREKVRIEKNKMLSQICQNCHFLQDYLNGKKCV